MKATMKATMKQPTHHELNNRRSRYAALLDRELPIEPPKTAGLKLASFFCGAGGFDLGFRSAGFELAFANDYYAKAAETFGQNLGHKPLLCDIREATADRIPVDRGIDVVTGGFPCVTFSTAGKRQGVEDTINGVLYLELCRTIREISPRYFVAENVKGMLSSNGGRDIKLVQAAFLRLGYRTEYRLINMAEHGVPQARMRVIFVGVRTDQWRGTFAYPRKTHRLRKDKRAPKTMPYARSVADAIEGLGPPIEYLISEIIARERKNVDGTGFMPTNRPTPPCEPSPTILAGGPHYVIQEPAPTAVSEVANVQPFVHAEKFRRMTVRECARVQSFPDWYEFAGNQADGYRQIGNAVPPLYAKQLARAIMNYDRRPIIGK